MNRLFVLLFGLMVLGVAVPASADHGRHLGWEHRRGWERHHEEYRPVVERAVYVPVEVPAPVPPCDDSGVSVRINLPPIVYRF